MIDVLTLTKIEKITKYARTKWYLWFKDENNNAILLKSNERTDKRNFDLLKVNEDYAVVWHNPSKSGLIIEKVIIANKDGSF